MTTKKSVGTQLELKEQLTITNKDTVKTGHSAVVGKNMLEGANKPNEKGTQTKPLGAFQKPPSCKVVQPTQGEFSKYHHRQYAPFVNLQDKPWARAVCLDKAKQGEIYRPPALRQRDDLHED